VSQQTYLNSPVRSCHTCVHRKANTVSGESFDHCRRWKTFCELAVRWSDHCGHELREWRLAPPKPPRRSLRRWLYDTLFAP
jgi:hypothetical protein